MANILNPAEKWFDKYWIKETKDLIRMETYREESEESKEACHNQLMDVRKFLGKRIGEINVQRRSPKVMLEMFEWVQKGRDPHAQYSLNPSDDERRSADYWVFGYAIGPENAGNRICIACHADVVPAQKDGTWDPFNPQVEPDVDYPAGVFTKTDVLVGRGAVDNKGQMASSLAIARAISEVYDGTDALNDTRIEFVCDSAEETKMGVPYYTKWRETQRGGQPPFDLGIVYDGAWMIVAEKGVERPAFSVDQMPTLPLPPLYLESLTTPEGTSVNTIADSATAVIKGDTAAVDEFYAKVRWEYDNCGWNDAEYTHKCGKNQTGYPPSRFEFDRKEENGVPYVELVTYVRGAQHGSQCAQNEANPLACLAYFVGGLVANGTLGVTPIGAMAHFIRWEWSTNVCGEDRPERLFREDPTFGKGVQNGTSYALTNLVKDDDGKITLRLDIRYTIGHQKGQEDGWDGQEGLLDDDSHFSDYFKLEAEEFMKENPTYPRVFLESSTMKYSPDLRDFDANQSCQILKKAYQEEFGKDPIPLPTGGSTDAKGNPCMVAVGLFGLDPGAPVNMHGVGEGCPIQDIRLATKVIYGAVVNAIEEPLRKKQDARAIKRYSESSNRMLKFLALDSDCGCNC